MKQRRIKRDLSEIEGQIDELSSRVREMRRGEREIILPRNGAHPPPRTWEGLRDRMFDTADGLLYGNMDFRTGAVTVREHENILWAATLHPNLLGMSPRVRRIVGRDE
jgi:hypothetical protein